MPYFYDANLDQDQDEENQGASGAAPVKLAGGSSSNEQTASAPSGSGTQKKALDTGSGYQNLDKYLSTNNAAQFGGQVLGKVEGKLNQAKENQTQASEQFKNQVAQSAKTPTQDQVNQALANPGQANAEDFQKWMSQSYEGPKSLAESQNTWNQYWSGANQAETQAKQLGSEAGRFSLLDSYFGRPQYSQGQKSLDNLLVQRSGLGDQSQRLQKDAAQIRTQGNEQAKNLQNVASQAAGQVDQSRNQVNQAFNQAQGQAQSEVESALSAANQKRAQDFAQLQQDFHGGSVSADQLRALGLSPGQTLYNLDPTSYLKQGSDLNRNQVMTPEQQARIRALSQLAGQEDTFAAGDLASADPFYNFDSARFQSDLGTQQRGYQNELDQMNQFWAAQIDGIARQAPQGRQTTMTGVGGNQDIINMYLDQQRAAQEELAKKYNLGSTIGNPLIQSTVSRDYRPMLRTG